jgi:hypothetical protein
MHGAYLHGGAILGLAISGYQPVQWFEEESVQYPMEIQEMNEWSV